MQNLGRRQGPALFAFVMAGLTALPSAAQDGGFKPVQVPVQVSKTPIIKLAPGQSLMTMESGLKDDQVIETASGTRMTVGRVRAMQAALTHARQKAPAPAGFALLPLSKASPVSLTVGETSAQLLARPATQVVRFDSGRTASVAQLQAMVPYIQQHYGINLNNPSPGTRPPLTGPAIKINSVDDLKKLPANAPASTILESPSGTRVTLGEVRGTLANSGAGPALVVPKGGAQ